MQPLPSREGETNYPRRTCFHVFDMHRCQDVSIAHDFLSINKHLSACMSIKSTPYAELMKNHMNEHIWNDQLE
jgi:hypothetical protein